MLDKTEISKSLKGKLALACAWYTWERTKSLFLLEQCSCIQTYEVPNHGMKQDGLG